MLAGKILTFLFVVENTPLQLLVAHTTQRFQVLCESKIEFKIDSFECNKSTNLTLLTGSKPQYVSCQPTMVVNF